MKRAILRILVSSSQLNTAGSENLVIFRFRQEAKDDPRDNFNMFSFFLFGFVSLFEDITYMMTCCFAQWMFL